MDSPLDQIEDAKAQFDIGTVAYRIFCGTRSEGASRYEAFLIIYAWFRAMFEHMKDGWGEEEDDGAED